jgi:hypothetical protein
MTDEQDQAEALDETKIGGEYPPDEPLGVEDYGTTAAEERVDEPLDERVAREVPEGTTTSGERVGELVDDPSDERELLGEEEDQLAPDPERNLDEPDEPDEWSAEQAAMHIEGGR